MNILDNDRFFDKKYRTIHYIMYTYYSRKKANVVTLGEKLRFYRTAEGYTQKEIAKCLGVERSTYTYYETEKSFPNVYTVHTLAKIYGVSMEFLLDEREIPFGGQEFMEKRNKKKR